MKINLTKAAVDALPFPEAGQVLYYDSKLQGFGLWITKTAKTYFAESRVNRKTVRTKIGRHGTWYPDKARDEAREILVAMSKGENPNITKANRRTLKEALEHYIKERSTGTGKQIKGRTKDGYRWLLDTPLKPYHDVPVADIDDAWVRRTYKKLTNDNGPVCATNAFRMIRAMFNFNKANPNPVRELSSRRLWNPEKRRSRFIRENKVGEWIANAEKLEMNMRGAILTMLFLGLRKNEVLEMKKSQVVDKCFFFNVGETKNDDDHLMPIGPYLWERIEPLLKLDGEYLFQSRKSKTGHIVDTRKAIDSLSDTHISNHDLRRTFVTHLNALEPAPSQYTIKRLMNHRQARTDVTAGYIQHERAKLIEVITRLEDSMVGTS